MKRSFNPTVHKVPFWRDFARVGGVKDPMFESLIRRAIGPYAKGGDSETAFESTTVSLTTQVPRPLERRIDERLDALLRLGKLANADGEQQLIKVKNMSAGGLSAILSSSVPAVGDQVQIELSSQKIPATVVWIRDNAVGFKFDQSVDL